MNFTIENVENNIFFYKSLLDGIKNIYPSLYQRLVISTPPLCDIYLIALTQYLLHLPNSKEELSRKGINK